MKKIDIFIKSYFKDYWLLYFALKSIAKNVTGYNNIILLIPEKDKEIFDTRCLPDRTLIHYVPDEGRGWLRQQWYKMSAHEYCDAEYIMFSDSDCLFTHPIDLQDFVKGDKPEILYTDWEKVQDAACWKEPTEKFLKDEAPYEMMRRNCQIHHRQTLLDISEYAPNLEYQIMSSHRFSEFNAIANYAYKYCRDRYRFVNTDDWTYVPPLAEQVWSHGSKEEGTSEAHLREYIRILETVIKSFGFTVP